MENTCLETEKHLQTIHVNFQGCSYFKNYPKIRKKIHCRMSSLSIPGSFFRGSWSPQTKLIQTSMHYYKGNLPLIIFPPQKKTHFCMNQVWFPFPPSHPPPKKGTLRKFSPRAPPPPKKNGKPPPPSKKKNKWELVGGFNPSEKY